MSSAAVSTAKFTSNTNAGASMHVDRSIRLGGAAEQEQLIQLNLTDLTLPKVNDLHVEGFKPSWFARLFGKR